ncbi:hypothetical protein M378DRAFT_165207, partial [Amanita muscaria Koide BX008]
MNKRLRILVYPNKINWCDDHRRKSKRRSCILSTLVYRTVCISSSSSVGICPSLLQQH